MKAVDCRNFVVAGHPGCGKTSLCELMLFKSNAVPRLGSVDTKTSVADFMPDEQERKSGIYSAALNCVWRDHNFFFIDTPGYGEFIGECAAAIRQGDAVLTVIDATDGPQVGTARAWKMAKGRRIPRCAFVSRLDRDRASFKTTIDQMRRNHGKSVIIPLYWPAGDGGSSFSRVVNVLFDKDVPPEIADDVAECRALWLDAIAETDDDLMTRYLDGEELSESDIRKGLAAAIQGCRVIPVFAGSAAKDIGVTELMDDIAEFFPSPYRYITVDGAKRVIDESEPALGIVFKSINDPFVGQLTFVRVVTGVFKSDSEVCNLSRPGVKERLGTLFFMNGKLQTPAAEAVPGCIFAVAKLKDTHVGDSLAANPDVVALPGIQFPNPVMSYAVTAVKHGDDDKISAALHKIVECDPAIRLSRNDETHEFLLSGMGDQHLGIVAKRLKDQFKVEANLATPKIAYRETVTGAGDGHYRHKKQTGGAGQFAEVSLKVSYNPDGFVFSNDVVGGAIPRNFIPAVEKGVNEMMTAGPLVGCRVERVKVSVYDGKYHPVDSNEMAFKTASRMAFRDAMAQANPILLEPIMKVTVNIPDSYTGDITGDLNHKRGRVLGMHIDEGLEVVEAEVPQSELSRYATELRSMTQGRGIFEMEFLRYEPVPPNIASQIIAKHQAEHSDAE
ncbi:MAG: elongation factor G [Victivallaceae bacterium]|nr:elongation factor G [Victivallaceae bacterium]